MCVLKKRISVYSSTFQRYTRVNKNEYVRSTSDVTYLPGDGNSKVYLNVEMKTLPFLIIENSTL